MRTDLLGRPCLKVAGDFMNGDLRLAEFSIDTMPDGEQRDNYFIQYCFDWRAYPYGMRKVQALDTLIDELVWRCMPATRQFLEQSLNSIGSSLKSPYWVSDIVNYSYGTSVDDHFWIRMNKPRAPQTFEENLGRLGYSEEYIRYRAALAHKWCSLYT